MSCSNRESILARQAEMLAEASAQSIVRPVPVRADFRMQSKAATSVLQNTSNQAPPAMSSGFQDASEHTDEDFDEFPLAPPHERGKRGVQMRNACVTYYTDFSQPIESYAPFVKDDFSRRILKPSHEHIGFYISCLEVAPTTHLLHGHLYIEFTQPKTILQIQKILGTDKCKIFIRKGTQKQATDYVFKRGVYESKHYTQLVPWLQRHHPDFRSLDDLVPFVYGSQKQQGSRSDLDRYVEMAFDGVQRNEFLASERGAGLRYLKYFGDACSIVDGLDRNDVARANKRVLYERYCSQCEQRNEVPCTYYQFKCEADFKWNPESQEHYVSTMSAAMDERNYQDQEEREGNVNKMRLDASLEGECECGEGSNPPPSPCLIDQDDQDYE